MSGYAYANVTILDGISAVLAAPSQPLSEGVASTFGVFVGAFGARSLPYQIHMDWGDGTSSDQSSSYAQVPPSFIHTYAATDPTTPGTHVTKYTATASVRDSQGRTASTSAQIAVQDVAPAITAPSYVPVTEGSVAMVTLATFADASLGPWHVVVDLGNGQTYDQMVATPGSIQVGVDASQHDRRHRRSTLDDQVVGVSGHTVDLAGSVDRGGATLCHRPRDCPQDRVVDDRLIAGWATPARSKATLRAAGRSRRL